MAATNAAVRDAARARLNAVFGVGGLHPVRQARLADAEVGRDLRQVLARLTVASDVHDIVAGLLG